ncbi:MAG: GTP-binding protein, partial [Clostridia bacterium]|nr:GTP-binding protein [Clostridia bacterium]
MSEIFHNIGILAHVDSGKTTLTEQLLYLTGAIRNAGSVDSGTAATDSLSVEKQRGISVRTATASTKWQDVTINIIDTPGHIDFAGEVERALSALDYAVVIVSAVEGVRAHTENILRSLDAADLPRLIFINKVDRAGADVQGVIKELREISSQAHIILSEIENEGAENCSVSAAEEKIFCERATETLADISDEAAELFLCDEMLTKEKADELIRREISSCTLTPVVFGSAKYSVGIKELADILVRYMPDSSRLATDELCGIVFKIEHDKSLGKVTHIRLFGGEIANRDEVELFVPEKNLVAQSDAVETEDKKSIRE